MQFPLYQKPYLHDRSHKPFILVIGFPLQSNTYENVLFISVKKCRPGKSVQMTEQEVRGLCLKSREIFLQQPILLELEAPLSICGKCTRQFCI